VAIAGDDTSGTITITTGTGCSVNGDLAAVTFANAFGTNPHISLTPGSSKALALGAYFDQSTLTNTGFSIGTNTIPAASTTYIWDYWAAQ
jgi:hypothetical protein